MERRDYRPSGASTRPACLDVAGVDYKNSLRSRSPETVAALYLGGMTISPAQCRAARGLLDWSQQELADASGVGNTTICNFEGGHASPQPGKLAALRRAFEQAGVAFVDKNGEGPGVRLSRGAGMAAESIPLENLNAENDE